MSKYDGDPRVVFNDDGSATLPDEPINGDWRVHEYDSVWVADNPVQGRLRSDYNGDFPATFRSRDEAIKAIVGEPQVSA